MDARAEDHVQDVFDYATELNTRNFGHAVAVDKDTIVVSHYVGRYVNVYTRSDPNDPTSLWTLRAKLEVPSLTHTDTEPDHWTEGFGYAVAVDGDTVVVSQPGAHAEGDDHETRRKYRGAVHVFTRDVPNDLTSTWRYVSRLSTDAFDDFAFVGEQTLFGQTLAIDGDVIVVGTDNLEGETMAEDIGKTTTQYPSECTGVHVFVRQPPGDLASEFKWIQVVDSQWGWTDGDMRCEPDFGKSGLAIRDGVLVVGSKAEWIAQRIDREGCGGEQGAAYVYQRIHPNARLELDAHAEDHAAVRRVQPTRQLRLERGDRRRRPNRGRLRAEGVVGVGLPGAHRVRRIPSSRVRRRGARVHAGPGPSRAQRVLVFAQGDDRAGRVWTRPVATGWTDAESVDAMFGAGLAMHEDTLAATCAHTKYFAAVFALDGVPTPWIPPEEDPRPWIDRLFADAGTTAASLVVLMGLGPSAALAVAAVFKPALRKWLIKHGMKRLADKIVPDLADDFRLMKIEMEEMKNFMAEQAFPRLKLGVDVRPEIAAEDIVFEPPPDVASSEGGPRGKIRGGASFGRFKSPSFEAEKCDVNTVLPGAGAVGVPDDVAKTMKKEINLISTFNHPNLVKVKGACAEKGQIVMEHCDGGTVGDRWLAKTGGDDDGMSPWQRAKIASQTAAAAMYLHRQGMAHGNLSADRVQLTSDGDAKLGEYGMKKTKKKVNKLTAAAIMIGAGIAKVAATTLEVAEAVMESYDPEAARGKGRAPSNENRTRARVRVDRRRVFGRRRRRRRRVGAEASLRGRCARR